MTNSINFTYYGDVLGTSERYSINQEEGYSHLNKFYNIVCRNFSSLKREKTIEAFLFSDSFFITGDNIYSVLKVLSQIYYESFKKNLYIRGAMVEGKLCFDPRMSLKNLIKNLPNTDVLFRAVQLEKKTKGARLLIERRLAQEIIQDNMYTFNDYIEHFQDIRGKNIPHNIVYNAESQSYEYYWPLDYLKEINDLEQLLKGKESSVPKNAIPHLRGTRKLFRNSKIIRSHLKKPF